MAQFSLIDVWAVHGDGGNEYNSGPVIGYCSTRALAAKAAKGQGWYERDGFIVSHPALCIDGTIWLLVSSSPIVLDEIQAARDAKLREETLASLSSEQRRVLGV